MNRRLVFIALTVFAIVLTVIDFLSDLFINRSAQVRGMGVAESWDITSGIAIAVWILVALTVWFRPAERALRKTPRKKR